MLVLYTKNCDGDVFKILQKHGTVEVAVGRVSVPGKEVQVELGLEGEVGFCLGHGAGSVCVCTMPGKNNM